MCHGEVGLTEDPMSSIQVMLNPRYFTHSVLAHDIEVTVMCTLTERDLRREVS